MRILQISLFLLFSSFSTLSAQYPIINAVISEPQPGKTVLEIQVSEFSDIFKMSYSLFYNSDALELDSIGDFLIPGNPSNSYIQQTAPGIIGTRWISPNGFNGFTLPNNTPVFRLYFSGSTVQSSDFNFSDGPFPLDVKSSGVELLPLFQVNGTQVDVLINSYGVDPIIYASVTPIEPGRIRVDIKTGVFIALLTLQYSFSYDDQVMTLDSFTQLQIPVSISPTVSHPAPGATITAWLAPPDQDEQGVTLPSCTVLQSLYFSGNGINETHFSFTNNPVAIEFSDVFGNVLDPVLLIGPCDELPGGGAETITNVTPINHRLTLELTPNPASGPARLAWNAPLPAETVVHVFNVQGQLVWQRPVSSHAREIQIPASDLPNGLYFCSLSGKGIASNTIKLVVQH